MKNILLMYKILHITHEKKEQSYMSQKTRDILQYKTLQRFNTESIKIEVLYSIKTDILSGREGLCSFMSLRTPGSISHLSPVFGPVSADPRGYSQTQFVELFRTHSAVRWV